MTLMTSFDDTEDSVAEKVKGRNICMRIIYHHIKIKLGGEFHG